MQGYIGMYFAERCAFVLGGEFGIFISPTPMNLKLYDVNGDNRVRPTC